MSDIERAVAFLLDETINSNPDEHHHHGQHQRIRNHLEHLETGTQIQLLRELLCVRQPDPPLPEELLEGIDLVLQQQRGHRLLTDAASLAPTATIPREGKHDIRLFLWQGDITTLSNVTAITNAANSQMLGCFQPSHRCIDNVIHSWAGPRLREECSKHMDSRGQDLEVGVAILTRGYCLPAPFVIHTVGPQLRRGASPTETDREQLASCYASVLETAASITLSGGERKAVALCGISTGLFAFPAREAAGIAVKAVSDWFRSHPDSSLTDVIFNTFTDADQTLYEELLSAPPKPWILQASTNPIAPVLQCDALAQVRQWLESADYVLVSAGAGLSAATGLDYTSTSLFSEHFPAFRKYGLTTLYSVFGFSSWPSEQDRWGYYFTHLKMVRDWPLSPLYQRLIQWLGKFGPNAFVQTSNADGFFLKHGWPEENLFTPQGRYSVFQCMANCRPDATFPSAPFLEAGLPHLHPVTQRLEDPEKVPLCRFCGGKMFICVRAASWFNETPFVDGQKRWKEFRRRALAEGKNVVILELGVGVSTPGVLRWPNERLVSQGDGKVKLIRIGLGTEVAVPWELESQGLATSIDGDILSVMTELF
ncbi:A1pp-domain-containing protein [Thozetella sp. PMI_491]|nr:A1pp-domain-containing protein [Thozetella sp. PMI_491]